MALEKNAHIKQDKMKTKEINLQQMELVPLTKDELINENGGLFWEAVATWVIEQGLDLIKANRKEIYSSWQQGVKANQDAKTGSWTPVGAGF